MAITFPRRRWDEERDCWVADLPPVDPRQHLERLLQANRHKLEATLPDGSWAYTERARELAAAQIIELNEQLAALEQEAS